MIDQVIRLEMLVQWIILTAIVRYIADPNVRLALEIQAMGALMFFNDPSIMPETIRNKMRQKMKIILLACTGITIYLAMRALVT